MPELPEVETVCRGIGSLVLHKKIISVVVKTNKLRWPVPDGLSGILSGFSILNIQRRSKYIIFTTAVGSLIVHLGMTGSLQIKPAEHVFAKHEHFNIIFDDQTALCYTDPRKFGFILWTKTDPLKHKLLKNLGLEPLESEFDANYFYNISRGRKIKIKQFIMDGKIVVGVGNIYANEALFAARINPLRAAGSLSLSECKNLVKKIKVILAQAIKHGGTTVKDFIDGYGQKGEFQNKLLVYGKQGCPCPECSNILEAVRVGQRMTVFCPCCQTE